MISLINFIIIFYALMIFIGVAYSIKNIYSFRIWGVIRWIIVILTIIVMIMFCCLLTMKEKTFSLLSTYKIIPINYNFIQDYKDNYIIFIDDKYVRSINIPKENTEIIYVESNPELYIIETIKVQTLNLPIDIVEDKIIENHKSYSLKIPNKSYVKTVKL